MESTKFPYDRLNCTIKIGSWQYDETRMFFISNLIDETKFDYIQHPNWDLIDVIDKPVVTDLRIHYDSSAPERYNIDIWYEIILQRKPAYYMINNIYPSLILNIVSLLAFTLPFASQVSLSN